MQFTSRRVTRVASLAVAATAFAVPLATTSTAGATVSPAITLSAHDNLVGGQVITVSGSGFDPTTSAASPVAVAVIECSTPTPSQANPTADCSTATAKVTSTDSAGAFAGLSFTLTSGAVGTNGKFCPSKVAGGGCYLIAAEPATPTTATEAALTFAPIITVTPNTNVTNGQKLHVSGYGFPASKTAYVTECASPPSATTCDLTSNVQVQTDANGLLSGAVVTVATGTWGGKSCSAGGSCLITATTDITGVAPDSSTAATFTFAKSPTTNAKTSMLVSGSAAHHKVKVSGAIKSKNAGVSGLTVRLYDRAKGTKTWHKVASMKSGKNGVFAFKGLKHFSHKEQYRVSHPRQKVGTTIYQASTSNTVTVS